MVNQATNLNQLWGFLIIEELIRLKINYFCISPGSRSTPLTLAAATNKHTETHIFFDERGAAFHTIGYTRATGKPAVLICTSGTAAANYLPAVIEAAQDFLPLIILSADRPPELKKTGANQTIDQSNIYERYVKWQFELPVADINIPQEMVLTTIDQAVYQANRQPKGPVHINCMFREPLISDSQYAPKTFSANLKFWKENDQPYTRYHQNYFQFPKNQYDQLANQINVVKKGLIIAGKLNNERESDSVLNLAKKLNWPVFADITSGLRFGDSSDIIIEYFDLMLLSETYIQSIKPEIILHFGGQLVSKRLLYYLQKISPINYYLFNNSPDRYDPLHIVSERYQVDVQNFCTNLIDHINCFIDERWSGNILESNKQIKLLVEKHALSEKTITEISVARVLSKMIPERTGLFLASSMPVRDMDMFAVKSKKQIFVGSNRGASGIDGTIAAAAGFARGLQSVTTLVIGDLAFIHDLNSLSQLNSLDYQLIIIVINNQGGGIFSFLPISRQTHIFEKYFGTPHIFDFKHAASLFHLGYHNPNTTDEFIKSYNSSLKSRHSTIIEIKTVRKDNYNIHKRLEAKIIELLEQ